MSKSRSERGKTPAQSQPPPVPVSNDIVPGRLTENDWNHLLDEETEEDFVTDILQDVISNALDTIYNKLIEKRVIPYTVNAARELLLDVIEWQFLVNDPGETNVETDETWLEDEEPSPGATDSWAQGIVPVMNIKEDEVTSERKHEENNNNAAEEGETEIDGEQNEVTESISTTFLGIDDDQEEASHEAKEDDSRPKERTSQQTKQKQVPKPPASKKMQEKSFKPYRGRLPSYHSITMTPVTDERPRPGNCHSIEAVNENGTGFLLSSESLIKAHYGMPPGTKDIAYDHKGNAIQMQKLNFDRLPSHRVKTRFTVVDPLEEAFQAKLANKKQRYNFLRHETKDTRKTNNQTISDKKTSKEKEMQLVSPLPPPLVDTIDVSPGVVIKEKGVIKRGLRQPLNQFYTNDASQLQPLGSSMARPSSKLREIISDPTPVVKQLNSNRPLPAIGAKGN